MNSTDKPVVLDDPLENLLSYQLRRAAFSTITPLAEAFAQIGLSSTEAIVIRFVRANPGCTQSDISKAIGVKRTNMVPVVSGLMHKGLLQRTAADGRSHSLYLTADAAEVLRKINKVAQQHEQHFFGDLSEDLKQILMKAFRTLRAKAEQLGG
jgi:DNA-binding MarR family transcriptional regulator